MADDKVKIDIRRVRKEPTIYEKNSLYLISDIGDENFVLIVTDTEGNPKKIEAEDLSEYAKLTDLPETSTLQELLDTAPEDIGKLQTPFRLNEWADSKYALKNHTHIWGDITDRPTKLTDFQNDLGNYGDWITEDDLDGYATEDWVEGKGYITSYEDTTYTAGEGLDLDEEEFSLKQYVLDAIEEAHTHPNKGVIDGITSENISNWDSAFQDSHTHANKTILDGIDSDDIDNWNEAYNNSHTHLNKSTLDGIQDSDISNWDEAYTKSHEHNNKTLLDSLEQGNLNKWNEAYDKAHTHSNKTVLDGILESDVNNWDEAYSKTHVHANKSTLDSILQGDLDNWDEAYSKSHTHANKIILDGISSSDIEDWEEAYDKKVNAISFTGDTNKTLTVTREDGSILTASFLYNNDPQFPDDVLNTLTFNDNNDGVLRAITSEGSIIDVSLDGRYSLLGHKHVWEDITDRPTSLSDFTNDLGNYGNWITKEQGDTYYSAIGHTHTFASLTSKPTTIAGYGITDFNSLGDARWALRSRTITGTGSLSGGGNLTANRTIDLSTTTKSDIAKGVTAHGWGNYRQFGLGNYVTVDELDLNNYLGSSRTGFYRFLGEGDNRPYPFGALINIAYTNSQNTQLAIPVQSNNSARSLSFRGSSIGDNHSWRNVWDDFNLPNPATQSWVNSQGFIKDLSNYYTKNESNSRYILKSGDIMTGRLTLDNALYGEHLRLFRGTYRADITMGANGHLALEANDYLLAGLSGTGTRMVTANASGSLGTQTIPTGNATHTGDVTGSTALTIANSLIPKRSTSLGSTNLNTLNTANHAGFYNQTSSANATTARNYPVNIAGNLRVYRDAGVVQIYNTYNGISTWRRHYYNSVWSAWTRIDVGFLSAGSNVSISSTGVISAVNTNTTYTTGTLAQLNAGTDNTGRLQTAKLLNDWLNAKSNATGTVADSLVKRDGTKINTAGGFFETSDRRLKTDIKEIGDILGKALNIPTVSYNMNKQDSIGTIAQDVQEIFPELVNTDEDGMLSVNYAKLSILAIKAIKELNKELEELKRRIGDE